MRKYEVIKPTPAQRVRLEKSLRWLSVAAFVSGVILSVWCMIWSTSLVESVRRAPVAGIGFMVTWMFVMNGSALGAIFITTTNERRRLLGMTFHGVYYWLSMIGIILCFSPILMLVLSMIYVRWFIPFD